VHRLLSVVGVSRRRYRDLKRAFLTPRNAPPTHVDIPPSGIEGYVMTDSQPGVSLRRAAHRQQPQGDEPNRQPQPISNPIASNSFTRISGIRNGSDLRCPFERKRRYRLFETVKVRIV
jgi:hypothetical protein